MLTFSSKDDRGEAGVFLYLDGAEEARMWIFSSIEATLKERLVQFFLVNCYL